MREIVTLERMHQAFATGLMEYGLMAGRKAMPPAFDGKAAAEEKALSSAR